MNTNADIEAIKSLIAAREQPLPTQMLKLPTHGAGL